MLDRGGTFTDIVGIDPAGYVRIKKILSGEEEEKVRLTEAIKELICGNKEETIPKGTIYEIRMGTTIGTNALLERKGEKCALMITKGFGDLLEIGYQDRPELFSLQIIKPSMLYKKVVELIERIGPDGSTITPLDKFDARIKLERLYNEGYRTLAVACMHSFAFPENEKKVGELAEEIGFNHISLSHKVIPLMKLVSRGDTTVLDAYLTPLLNNYLLNIQSAISRDLTGGPCQENNYEPRTPKDTNSAYMDPNSGPDLLFMQSNGGLISGNEFRGKNCILSGPAGGVIGAVEISREIGENRIITFDMGGTSTDVSHFRGELERSYERKISGVRIRAPMLNIKTIASGGGSVLHYRDSRFIVGPDSAGSDPGPKCYRKGGPLTLTDANLFLGRIQPDHFPKIFGMNGDEAVDIEAVETQFHLLTDRINIEHEIKKDPYEVAQGFLDVAVENMAQAIKSITLRKGYDVKEYLLCCFGGAGGQHVCRVADSMGVKRILVHPLASVLSAYGMGLSARRSIRECSIETNLNAKTLKIIYESFIELENEVKKELGISSRKLGGDTAHSISIKRRVKLKFTGTDTSIEVDLKDVDGMKADFLKMHRIQFGFIYTDRELSVDSISVEAVEREEMLNVASVRKNPAPAIAIDQVEVYFDGKWMKCPAYQRSRISPGEVINGPALVIEDNTTTVIYRGWQGRGLENGCLIMETAAAESAALKDISEADPIQLQIFSNIFASIAERMGYVLMNTSTSVNIRERRDFSCAIFDPLGNLVANAPHIPVHLGSMSHAVKSLKRKFTFRPGDVYMVNSPYDGGTHLPDITVVDPVFDKYNDEILFFVASRGHHSDIGGISPGSMPALSKHIDEEGFITSGFLLQDRDGLREKELLELFSRSKYPPRDPLSNIADLKAQMAANIKGIQEINLLISQYGKEMIHAYMNFIRENAKQSVISSLEGFEDRGFTLRMDNGGKIKFTINLKKDNNASNKKAENSFLCIDLDGSSNISGDNFNAPIPVLEASVLYTIRTIINRDIPLNQGCLEPIRIQIPSNSFLNPAYPSAVAAGNVETSQALVNALMGALDIQAGSQGTMNNIAFGNDNIQYYETICGGTGAGKGYDGCSAIHSHMTNTRITDPEVIEHNYPVILEEFSIRRGSGGRGAFEGGNGVVRKIRFLENVILSVITSNRKESPFGIKGGQNGKPGENILIRKNEKKMIMGSSFQEELEAGDKIVIKTPGGGGYGRQTKNF